MNHEDRVYQIAPYRNGRTKMIVYYGDEEFKPDPNNSRYMVGNKGTIVDKENMGKLLPARNKEKNKKDKKEYIWIPGVGYKEIDRMVMNAHCPYNENNNLEMEIVHKNMNPFDNRYNSDPSKSNLEWKEKEKLNIKKINHMKSVNHTNAKYTEEEIHKFCQLLEKGYNARQICEKCDMPYNNAMAAIMSSLRNKTRYKDISSQYNLSPAIKSSKKSAPLSKEKLLEIKNYINKGYTPLEIANLCGLNHTKSFDVLISNIKTGHRII